MFFLLNQIKIYHLDILKTSGAENLFKWFRLGIQNLKSKKQLIDLDFFIIRHKYKKKPIHLYKTPQQPAYRLENFQPTIIFKYNKKRYKFIIKKQENYTKQKDQIQTINKIRRD